MVGQKDERKIYISSADIMTRNLARRVEIACPVLDPELKSRIEHTAEVILLDNVKLRELKNDGNYIRVTAGTEKRINAQDIFIEEAKAGVVEILGEDTGFREDRGINGFFSRLKAMFSDRQKS